MKARPNESVFIGHVKALRPQPDGWGAEMDLVVMNNLSEAGQDFVQSKAGDSLTMFVPDPKGIAAGDRVRVTATLNAGPGGEKVVARSIERDGPGTAPGSGPSSSKHRA